MAASVVYIADDYRKSYYDGFHTFSWLADLFSIPIDQLNFVLTQITALTLAGLFRSSLSANAVTATTRHGFGLIIGLILGYFCFGRQAVHLTVLPALCYVAIRTQNPHHVQRVVLALAFIYLSCIHFYRQIYDYGSYTLDITGPLMVITQKVTSLAYSIHDGLTRRKDDLSPMQQHQAVYKIPTTLEFFSYILHFQALMAGPVIYYRDYIDFIHGKHLYHQSSMGNSPTGERISLPSPEFVVAKKVTASLTCAVLFVTFITVYPIQTLKDENFLNNTSILYKLWYIYIATLIVRFKYYHAWIFADAICNNSGLGFNGLDENGKAQWNLFSNINVWKFETSLNLRESVAEWNMGTNRWLRSIVYERHSRQKMLLTFALSALWHGFYPGYYLTFANGAFFTMVARIIRRRIRPYFLGSKQKKFLYDLLTFMTTRIIMAYITFSFILLEFLPSVKIYLYFYFAPHILGLTAITILPLVPSLPSQTVSKYHPNDSQSVSNGNAHKTM